MDAGQVYNNVEYPDYYEIVRIHGWHMFGRRLVRGYGNNVAMDEVYEVSVGRHPKFMALWVDHLETGCSIKS